MNDDDSPRWPFPYAPPRPVKGGIRARSRRGPFASSWWAQRWIAVLEALQVGGRLARGRSYARRGQVVSLDVQRGSVEARVQGSRPEPYEVKVRVRPLAAGEWDRVLAALSAAPLYAAQLLAGQMPADVEAVFQRAGVSLFPARLQDLETGCSCPDWSNPCKHVAAVYYLLGEEFDRDPFLILKLRGLSREEMVGGLAAQEAAARARRPRRPKERPPAAAGLPSDREAFWKGGPLPDLPAIGATSPGEAALLRRLGGFPFWRGRVGLMEALVPVYAAATRHAEAVVLALAPPASTLAS